jgi:arginyl-tRNA synthetase
VLRQLAEKQLERDPARGSASVERLTEEHEQDLITLLARYPEVVEAAALSEEPHQLAHFLRDVANAFHTYYNAHQFLVDDAALRDARLNLCEATAQVIRNGLELLGVGAPEEM